MSSRRYAFSLNTRSSLLSEMGAVLFVFRADILQYIAIRHQHLGRLYCNRLGVRFGIVDGQLQIHMTEVTPVEPLPNPEFLTLWVSHRIQPALVVESRRIHDQRIALPTADRIAHPRWLPLNWKLAAIRVYL